MTEFLGWRIRKRINKLKEGGMKMRKICFIILLLALMLGGNSCGRSTEKSETSPSIDKPEKKLNAMEEEIIGEGETLEDEAEPFKEEMSERTDITDEE